MKDRNLEKKIKKKKNELNELVLKESSDKTLKVSQELDVLINEYYRVALKK